MKSIIVAYPNKNTAMQLRNVLEDDGLHVSHICATGASILGIASDMRGGVIVMASSLSDMSANMVADRLSAGFDIVAISSNPRESYMEGVVTLPLPLNKQEFLRTVEVLVATDSSFTSRSFDDAEIISSAKHILMKVKDIDEMQAHKYLQQQSMRRGKKLVQIASEIIKEYKARE